MEKYYYAKGRRKRSTATVRLFEGKGLSTVNNKPLEEVYGFANDKKDVQTPFMISDSVGKFYFTARTEGGGTTGQRDAIKLAISRALIQVDPIYRSSLKSAGLLTRDDRKVERKKTGLKKARKAPQFSKR